MGFRGAVRCRTTERIDDGVEDVRGWSVFVGCLPGDGRQWPCSVVSGRCTVGKTTRHRVIRDMNRLIVENRFCIAMRVDRRGIGS